MEKHNIILAGVLGLDLTDVNHAVFIGDVTSEILDMDMFIQYCRDHKAGIEYVSKTEKLDILATRYKKIQIDKQLEKQYGVGERFSKALAEKVKQCRNFVEEECTTFERVKANGEMFFSKQELTALQNIGSVSVIIEYSRQDRLEGEIYKFFVTKSKQALLPKAKKSAIQIEVKRF